MHRANIGEDFWTIADAFIAARQNGTVDRERGHLLHASSSEQMNLAGLSTIWGAGTILNDGPMCVHLRFHSKKTNNSLEQEKEVQF
jgi:hypothetical protein